jgi:hypothetical protein
MRRLLPLRRPWIAPISLAFVQRPGLVELAEQSGCRALFLDGGEISQAYLTTEAPTAPELVASVSVALRQLTERGILTVCRFVFGYDTDDEGVFERTVRFCTEARIGLPQFSVFTPHIGSELFTALEREGRLLHTDASCYDGSHVVFRPKLMMPGALQNGLYWARQQTYTRTALWRRVFTWNRRTPSHLLSNYTQGRRYTADPRGVYTEAMQLLSQLSQPIPVREQASFISTLKTAVGETRRHLHGTWLRTRAIRDEHLKALTLRLEGVLDASSATEVLQRIQHAIRAGHQKVVLDLKGLELVSPTVITNFLEENAHVLTDLRDRVAFRHLRTVLEALKENLGGVLPNAELFELVSDESA